MEPFGDTPFRVAPPLAPIAAGETPTAPIEGEAEMKAGPYLESLPEVDYNESAWVKPLKAVEPSAVSALPAQHEWLPQVDILPEFPSAGERIGRTFASLRAKTGEVAGAARQDYQESPRKMRALGNGFLALTTQTMDRLRLSVVLVPHAATEVLSHTHSPTEAGLAAGSVFAAWCLGVGESLNQGMSEYPKAVDKASKNFPGLVDLFADSLPGFEEKADDGNTALPRKIGRQALTHLRRGLAVTGIGSTAYVATAATRGRSKSDIRRLTTKASLDGGLIAGGVVGAIGETIVKIGDKHPLLAERIQNDASNIKLWYAIAGALMVEQYVESRFKRRKLSDSQPT
ncbi:MAG TPA: hypothetical protein VG992_00180 [Candidatus Saccharimonadales bacterium]|nr:hypothetical protein [Candidatus Saccharimonadales bacterium]